MNAFFKSQFNYFPLISICCNHSLINKTNRLHERCLRIVYSNKESIFEGLLKRDGSVTIYHQIFGFLAIQMFNVFK